MEISNAKANFGLRATAGYQGALVAGEVVIGAANTGIPLTGADVAYSLRVQGTATITLNVKAGTNDGASTAATLTVDPTGTNNSVLYTAHTAGTAGNAITVAYATPAAQATTGVAVVGNAITVTPGTKARMVLSGGLSGTLDHVSGEGQSAKYSNNGLPLGTFPATVAGLYGEYTSGYWHIKQVATDGAPASSYTASATGGTWPDSTGNNPFGGSVTVTAATSSAAQVIAAVNASSPAYALVTASASGTVTGAVAAITAASLTGGASGTSSSGTDIEGLAIPAIATVQGILIEVTTGGGTINGTSFDSLHYAAGDVIPLYNPSGITSDLADTLTITPDTTTDMTITVIGRTT